MGFWSQSSFDVWRADFSKARQNRLEMKPNSRFSGESSTRESATQATISQLQTETTQYIPFAFLTFCLLSVQWFVFNDGETREIPVKKLCQLDPYLLFYQRV